MPILTNPLQCLETEIRVETRLGCSISNHQPLDFSQQEENQFAIFEEQYPNIRRRTKPICAYNCHGLVFASRRTWICDSHDILTILEHDGYAEIPESEVLSGDVVIYRTSDGDFQHSGIFIQWFNKHLKIPLVLSKWGKYSEVIHQGNDCPYDFSKPCYYRVTHGTNTKPEHGKSYMEISGIKHPKIFISTF